MSTFLTQAEDKQLIENGFEPIPVAGKAAVAQGWQAGAIDAARMAAMREVYPQARNTGIRLGKKLAAVDIDVVCREHAAAVIAMADEMLGVTPLRRFGSKGLMLCYRNESPFRKISVLTDAATPAAFADKVEILGSGSQFVAFGIHPDTQRPFEWRGKDDFDEPATPLTTPVAALPLVTPEKLTAFAESCKSLFSACGYAGARVRVAATFEKKEREVNVELDSELNVSRAKEHLRNCVEQGKVAIVGQLGSDTIYELAATMMDRFALSSDLTEKLMLEIWYPHCIPNTLEDECRTIIAHAASYMQNETGARALPPAAEMFREALDKLPPETDEPGEAGNPDLGLSQTIVLQDENYDNEDSPTPADQYIRQKFPPLRELIPIWCERNVNTFLEGPAATHKSRAALQDAICLSTGLPVMGQGIKEPCETIYMNYENTPEEMARRVHRACTYLQGDNQSDPIDPSGVHIWELRQHPRPIIMVKHDGAIITRFGRRFLSLIASRRNAGKHTLVVFDGLMDAIIFLDNTRNDDAMAMGLIRLLDSWCAEYDFTAYSIIHPSRSSERGKNIGSYATAWTTKPRAIQTFKRVLSPFAGGGPKAKYDEEETPIEHVFFQRRVHKRNNGPEGEKMLLEYWRGGLRPHHPPNKRAATTQSEPPQTEEFEDDVQF